MNSRDELKPSENQLVVPAVTPQYDNVQSLQHVSETTNHVTNSANKKNNKKKVHGKNRIEMYESGDYEERPLPRPTLSVVKKLDERHKDLKQHLLSQYKDGGNYDDNDFDEDYEEDYEEGRETLTSSCACNAWLIYMQIYIR